MRTFMSCVVILNGALAMAQPPSLQNQQQTSGVIGITPGQTARFNVLYPTAPAPILQPLCSATLTIADDQGKVLKTSNIPQFTAGKSVSLDLNADTDLAGNPRTEVHAFSVAPAGCNFTGTLELIDNVTQKTEVVTGTAPTYPSPQPAPGAQQQTPGPAEPGARANRP